MGHARGCAPPLHIPLQQGHTPARNGRGPIRRHHHLHHNPVMPHRSLFHFAFHVTDLDAARRFYGGVLGCTEGRSTATWVDFDFFGHQISLHLGTPFATTLSGKVGDVMVPMPHFGLVLDLPAWRAMAARLEAAGTVFVLSPHVRFAGLPGEQWTMFFCDPFGNPLEIKGFASLEGVYAAS
jgi:uncharacterized protein